MVHCHIKQDSALRGVEVCEDKGNIFSGFGILAAGLLCMVLRATRMHKLFEVFHAWQSQPDEPLTSESWFVGSGEIIFLRIGSRQQLV